ncbi:MAG: hypothetical protein AB7E37_03455 [Candidatus Altimarinota bacterium]
MKFSRSGTTIIESIVVMMIVVIGIIGMYSIFINSQNVATSTSNRVQAISMAREGIEALMNIRDTNWLLFAANTGNCWHTFNYDGNCILAASGTTMIQSGSYIVYQNESNNRWFLSGATSGNYSDINYRNRFRVNIGSGGLYTQSGGENFNPLFTREIKISYVDNLSPPQKMKVESIVRWTDSARNSGNYEINLDTILTNWKK